MQRYLFFCRVDLCTLTNVTYPSEIYMGNKTPRRLKQETQTLFEVGQDIIDGRHER
jgi:hypothetical protein